MRKPQGYGIAIDPVSGKVIEEHDTFTCARCSVVVRLKPFEQPQNYCKQTMRPICDKCVAESIAMPWEERVRRASDFSERLRRMPTNEELEAFLKADE